MITQPPQLHDLTRSEHLQRAFKFRLWFSFILVMIAFAGLATRLVWLQWINHSHYRGQAENNRISMVPLQPNRGVIVDRHGTLLANNYAAYTLELTPSQISNLDQTIESLSKLIEITPRDRKRFKRLLDESRRFESVPLKLRLNDQEVAILAAHRYRFTGVEIKARLFRYYPQGETAAHVIGYIGRISQKDRDRLEDLDDADNYRGAQHIGKEGVEKRYEHVLRGGIGAEEVEISASGRAVRTLSRTSPQSGNHLVLSIDLPLQAVAERAFAGRRGALVAIEPSTGDILAWVSTPSFDPNLFVDGIDQDRWNELNQSLDRPLINRPLLGAYPPGSTYKPFMALAALETGKRTAQQAFQDPGYYVFGGRRFRDDKVGGHGYVNMHTSIVHSCDTYYYLLANDLGVDGIANFMRPFGFGRLTEIDLDGEKKGILPSTEWKRKAYKKPELKKWYLGETISVAIGQGYNSFTPLQLAHATANLANRGIVMKPHLVKFVRDPISQQDQPTVPKESFRIPLKSSNLDVIRRAMVGVNIDGTGAKAFYQAPYTVAGKTGTSQVFSLKQNEKYDEKKVPERLRDHALYVAFAPAEKPRIALAVLVENGGFGGQTAAPIARTVLDFYLLGIDRTLSSRDKP